MLPLHEAEMAVLSPTFYQHRTGMEKMVVILKYSMLDSDIENEGDQLDIRAAEHP